MLLELHRMRADELLRLYCGVLEELSARGICRSTNNPVADLSEFLAVTAMRLQRAQKSTKGFDALDSAGKRYEIKGRRVTAHNPSRMLSAIRDCAAGHFDYLIGVLYDENFAVSKACVVPFEVVLRLSRYREHVNAHILDLRDSVWQEPGVRDITLEIRQALSNTLANASRA
jgi:hypothetical protein